MCKHTMYNILLKDEARGLLNRWVDPVSNGFFINLSVKMLLVRSHENVKDTMVICNKLYQNWIQYSRPQSFTRKNAVCQYSHTNLQ